MPDTEVERMFPNMLYTVPTTVIPNLVKNKSKEPDNIAQEQHVHYLRK